MSAVHNYNYCVRKGKNIHCLLIDILITVRSWDTITQNTPYIVESL